MKTRSDFCFCFITVHESDRCHTIDQVPHPVIAIVTIVIIGHTQGQDQGHITEVGHEVAVIVAGHEAVTTATVGNNKVPLVLVAKHILLVTALSCRLHI